MRDLLLFLCLWDDQLRSNLLDNFVFSNYVGSKNTVVQECRLHADNSFVFRLYVLFV